MPILARVRQYDNELTQASFLDRSAAVSGCPSVESFCFDQGLDLRALRKGCPKQLTELAACLGADPALALANAIRETGPRSFELRRCHVVSNMLRTDELALCPACVRDDLANGPARRTPYDNIWLRIPWHFRWIETCPIHKFRLERFSLARTKHDRRSFVVFGWDAAYQLESGRRELLQQEPTQFENYMVGRLQGTASDTWLDKMPFSEAVRLCGAFGQLRDGEMESAANAISSGEEDRWTREAGFQMLRRDPQSITAFLDTSFSKRGELVTAVAVKRMLGPYLSSIFKGHRRETTSFNVFREEVWSFIKHHRARPKSAIPRKHKGSKSTHKKALTVEAAAARFALPHDAILLFASDAIQPFDSDGSLTDAAIKCIRARRQALLSMEQVRSELGILNGSVWCLSDAGLLGAVLRGPHGNLSRKFDPSSVSSLLRRLEGAASAMSAGEDWITPSEAAKKYQCGLDTVIQILLSAKLQRVSHDPKVDGLSALRFCEKEFFRHLTGVEWFGIPARQTSRLLGISYVALSGLIRLGYLEQIQFGKGSGTIAYISETSILAFRERYITAAAAAAIHRRHSSTLVRDLEKKGVRPDILCSMAGANFYLRKRFGL